MDTEGCNVMMNCLQTTLIGISHDQERDIRYRVLGITASIDTTMHFQGFMKDEYIQEVNDWEK